MRLARGLAHGSALHTAGCTWLDLTHGACPQVCTYTCACYSRWLSTRCRLQFDVDFAENGAIITADEVQSQYWKINSFTLFVQVVSFLLSDAWKSRTSVLSRGAAVTVELEGASTPGSLEPGKGSFWAEVVVVPPAGEVPHCSSLAPVAWPLGHIR
jgi:hypothetical protein